MRLFILSILVAFLSITGLFAQNPSREVRKGNKQFEKGVYDKAEYEYRRALEIDEKSAPANNNLGSTLYKQKQYEAAESKYQQALDGTKTRKSNPSDYWYNLGNTYFQQQKLKESIEAYKSALRLNPSDADAKHNLMLAQQMQQQQEQQQQQNKDQENKDQDQDKQQQDQDKKDDQQKEEQQNQQQQEDQNENPQQQQQQQQQQQSQQISKEDAERLLKAVEQDEKDVLKKLQEEKAKARKVPTEKEW